MKKSICKIEENLYVYNLYNNLCDLANNPNMEKFNRILPQCGRLNLGYENVTKDNKIILAVQLMLFKLESIYNKLGDNTEYYVKDNVTYDKIIGFNEVIDLYDIESDECKLFRISGSEYNWDIPQRSAKLAIKKFVEAAPHHFMSNEHSEYKLNSFSKSLGVCLFKYMDCPNGNVRLYVSKKVKTNSVYDSNGESIPFFSAIETDANDICNIILDITKQSEKIDNTEFNALWGKSADNMNIRHDRCMSNDGEVVMARINADLQIIDLKEEEAFWLLIFYSASMLNKMNTKESLNIYLEGLSKDIWDDTGRGYIKKYMDSRENMQLRKVIELLEYVDFSKEDMRVFSLKAQTVESNWVIKSIRDAIKRGVSNV